MEQNEDFRPMRRKKQLLSTAESLLILEKQTAGTLALLGDNGYPYSVPISYVYHENKIWMHSAKEGHKIDALTQYDKASFCVIEQDQIVPQEYTTYFRSVIAFGKIGIVEDEAEKRMATEILARKYSPNLEEGIQQEISKSLHHMHLLEFSIEHLTGKEAIELVRAKKMNHPTQP